MHLHTFKNVSWLVIVILSSMTIMGCGGNNIGDQIDIQEELEESILKDYFAANDLTPQKSSSGLYYTIEELGSGGSPSVSDTASVFYIGSFLNGNIFDSTLGQIEPADLAVSEVIEGFGEGMQLIQRGGKIKLIIPSRLAYGTSGRNGISPNTILLFDVELIDFF